MSNTYMPIIKTGEAEVRAVENSSYLKDNENIIPIIELTRGRKKTTKLDGGKLLVTYPYVKRLASLKKSFSGKTVAIDLTSEDDLLSSEIMELYDPTNGYGNWINFLKEIHDEGCFKSVIPSVLLNWNDNSFVSNVEEEVKKIGENFDSILYRCSLESKDCYEELPLLVNAMTNDKKLFILIDAGYLQEAMEDSAANVFISRISNIKNMLKDKDIDTKIIVSSTSFPNNVTEYPIGTIREIEKYIYDTILKQHSDTIYSDYATVNPIRNDMITMARGWIPRIDVPINNKIYFYRQRRPQGMTAYQGAYTFAAGRAVSDKRFPGNLNIWGTDMIRSCAFGSVPSSKPNFWISVRMNIHMYQTLKWLETLER